MVTSDHMELPFLVRHSIRFWALGVTPGDLKIIADPVSFKIFLRGGAIFQIAVTVILLRVGHKVHLPVSTNNEFTSVK